jgi:hypothetical protein
VEVRALEVRQDLKVLLPYGVLLIMNWEKCDRQCCYSGEAVLTQGGEGDVRHHLDAGVGHAADDGPRPRLHAVKGIIMLTSQCPSHGPWTVDNGSLVHPVIAEMQECIV